MRACLPGNDSRETAFDHHPELLPHGIDVTLDWTYIAMPESAGNQHQVAGISVQGRGETNAERVNRHVRRKVRQSPPVLESSVGLAGSRRMTGKSVAEKGSRANLALWQLVCQLL